MRITIIAVGKLKDRSLEGLVKEYAKRLPSWVKLEWIEAPAAKGKGEARDLMAAEAKAIRARLPARARLVALSEKGKEYDSAGFAAWLGKLRDHGDDLCLVIGGPDGLDPTLIKDAHEILSLSRLTFPHDLVRVILAEQLYRACSILQGSPYHRA